MPMKNLIILLLLIVISPISYSQISHTPPPGGKRVTLESMVIDATEKAVRELKMVNADITEDQSKKLYDICLEMFKTRKFAVGFLRKFSDEEYEYMLETARKRDSSYSTVLSEIQMQRHLNFESKRVHITDSYVKRKKQEQLKKMKNEKN